MPTYLGGKMITPLSHANGCLTQKYINSDFDHVVNVSENMQSIKNVELNEHQINNVSDNMDAVKNVHHHMNDVLHVSGNMDDINKVVADEVDIGKVANNITEVVQVANGMEEYQVTEEFTLEQGQTTVQLNSILAQTAKVEVVGQMVDGTVLLRDTDFTVTAVKRIELRRSYPAGTVVKVTQVVYKNQDDPYIVIDELSAFNRKTLPIGIGVDISPYEDAGRTVTPRLLVKSTSYVNIEPIPANTTITSVNVTKEPNGVIVVQTSNGAIKFSSVLAEAFTREEIGQTATSTYHYSATGGETTVTVPYSFGRVQALFINGIKQLRDYAWEWEEADGNTITLAEALVSGDQVEAVVGDEKESLVPAMQGDLSEGTVLASGSTSVRTLKDRFADYVSPLDYGAVGDGITDDSAAIQSCLNSNKYVDFGSKSYRCISSIYPQRDSVLKGTKARLIFSDNGINLGSYQNNRFSIIGIEVRREGTNYGGFGIYSNGGSFTYNFWSNIIIRGFIKGIWLKAPDSESILTWGLLEDITIYYCDVGMHLSGGWINTVTFNTLNITQTKKEGIIINDSGQVYNCIFNSLSLEACCLNADVLRPAFTISNVTASNIRINGLYAEAIGYRRVATPAEITDFKTNGTPITGFFYNSKSWRKSGEIYSEDTGDIVVDGIGNLAVIGVVGGGSDIMIDIEDVILSTNNASFISLNDASARITVDKCRTLTKEFFWCNVRNFIVCNPQTGGKPKPIIKMTNMRCQGGNVLHGHLSNYTLAGESAHGFTINKELYITNNSKFTNVGAGWNGLPVLVSELDDIIQLSTKTDRIIIKENVTVNVSDNSKYIDNSKYYSVNIDSDNMQLRKTLTIKYMLGSNRVRLYNTYFRCNAHMVLDDVATSANQRPIVYFYFKEFNIDGNFEIKANVAPSVIPANLLDSGVVIISGNITYNNSSSLGSFSTNLHYTTYGGVAGSVPPGIKCFPAAHGDLPIGSAYIGMTFYEKDTNKLKVFNGTSWVNIS